MPSASVLSNLTSNTLEEPEHVSVHIGDKTCQVVSVTRTCDDKDSQPHDIITCIPAPPKAPGARAAPAGVGATDVTLSVTTGVAGSLERSAQWPCVVYSHMLLAGAHTPTASDASGYSKGFVAMGVDASKAGQWPPLPAPPLITMPLDFLSGSINALAKLKSTAFLAGSFTDATGVSSSSGASVSSSSYFPDSVSSSSSFFASESIRHIGAWRMGGPVMSLG